MTIARRALDGGAKRPYEDPGARSADAADLASFRPQKSKGQNFLVQRHIADRIAAAAQLKAADDVIEVGPGLGILSEAILQTGVHSLVMIELDVQLAAALKARFRGDDRVSIINRDFLALRDWPVNGPAKIVANLPFNVASAILERLCAHRLNITRMVLMFQREVAGRIRAGVGDSAYGALSVYTAIYWNVTDHFRVAGGNFFPRPKIDAEVLVFEPRSPALISPDEERATLSAVRAAFAAPRKTLRNALATGLGIEAAMAEVILARAGIDPSARAAMLGLSDFLRLARAIEAPGPNERSGPRAALARDNA
ncbi:MAG: 16S rRNA (adenine(1518)-N(6)/adenine(1519)-N(6))-dimethyltransferase RsmA [Candidatus Binataceae bacterium]|jgi:16S rRNA (adenine1518-N6/adenine1519-N6)-dimethyltransferase